MRARGGASLSLRRSALRVFHHPPTRERSGVMENAIIFLISFAISGVATAFVVSWLMRRSDRSAVALQQQATDAEVMQALSLWARAQSGSPKDVAAWDKFRSAGLKKRGIEP